MSASVFFCLGGGRSPRVSAASEESTLTQQLPALTVARPLPEQSRWVA